MGAGGYGPSGTGSGTSVGNGSQQMAQDAQSMAFEKANMESNTALAIEQIRGQTARDVAKIQTAPAKAELPIKQQQADTARAAQQIQDYLAENKVRIDWDKWLTEKPTKTEAFVLHKLMLSMGVENMIVSAIMTQLKAMGFDPLDPNGMVSPDKLQEIMNNMEIVQWMQRTIAQSILPDIQTPMSQAADEVGGYLSDFIGWARGPVEEGQRGYHHGQQSVSP